MTWHSDYDRLLRPRIFEPWANVLLDFVGLGRGQVVVDVATGPGTVARVAAERVGPTGRVTGVDLSGPMLAVARAKPILAGMAPIEYVESPAAPLAVPDDAFDVAFCQHGLHQFPERLAALSEMRRALKPGGRIAVATWDAAGPLPLSVDSYAGQVGEVIERKPELEFGRHPKELEEALVGAGFREVHAEQKALSIAWEGGVEQILEYLSCSRRRDLEALVDGGVLRYTTRANLARGVK